jgi:hypothetical protein
VIVDTILILLVIRRALFIVLLILGVILINPEEKYVAGSINLQVLIVVFEEDIFINKNIYMMCLCNIFSIFSPTKVNLENYPIYSSMLFNTLV